MKNSVNTNNNAMSLRSKGGRGAPKGRNPAIRQAPKSTIVGPKGSRNFGGQNSVSAPVARARQQRLRAPRIMRVAGGTKISHRELIQTVNGSIAFTAIKFACNPGISATFPWLASQAAQWEQYRFTKLNFEYITRTASTTVGSVLLAPDYDASDPAPVTEAQASTYQDVAEDVPWKDICCNLSVASMHALGLRKFTRVGSVGLNDIKTYDVANFYLCTVEEIGTAAIGKLWVDYDVEFFVPQTISPSGTAPLSPSLTSLYTQSINQAFTTGLGATVHWNDLVYDPLGIGAGAAGIFTPPAGAYRVFAQVSVQDNANEVFTAQLALAVNGAATVPPIQSEITLVSGPSDQSLSLEGIVLASGTTTFEVFLTMTGAAGTLIALGNFCQLVISPA
jgi:hypothetical protein